MGVVDPQQISRHLQTGRRIFDQGLKTPSRIHGATQSFQSRDGHGQVEAPNQQAEVYKIVAQGS